MTATERRERGTRLCRHLNHDVDEMAPAGIGRWTPGWEIVDPAGARFMRTLSHWEGSGAEVDRLAVRDAYDEVLRAWGMVVRLYQEHVSASPGLRGQVDHDSGDDSGSQRANVAR